jgi:hypothetical protein
MSLPSGRVTIVLVVPATVVACVVAMIARRRGIRVLVEDEIGRRVEGADRRGAEDVPATVPPVAAPATVS